MNKYRMEILGFVMPFVKKKWNNKLNMNQQYDDTGGETYMQC